MVFILFYCYQAQHQNAIKIGILISNDSPSKRVFVCSGNKAIGTGRTKRHLEMNSGN